MILSHIHLIIYKLVTRVKTINAYTSAVNKNRIHNILTIGYKTNESNIIIVLR
jgi:hypothetical protein